MAENSNRVYDLVNALPERIFSRRPPVVDGTGLTGSYIIDGTGGELEYSTSRDDDDQLSISTR